MKSNFLLIVILSALLGACSLGTGKPSGNFATVAPETQQLIWERSGGFAGFCDRVTVFSTGRAHISSCKGVETDIQLTDTERRQLKGWIETYARIEHQLVSPALADSMTTTLILASSGEQTADETTINTIMEFAASLQARATYEQEIPGAERSVATQTLRDFLNALNTGDYILAAKLYDGDTSLLITWNAGVSADLSTLLELACTQNRLHCLAVRTLNYRGPNGEDGFQFLVEFSNPDGTLFVLGENIGEATVVKQFLYKVVKAMNGYVVMDLPPYSP